MLETATGDITSRIKSLDRELKKAVSSGHVIRLSQFKMENSSAPGIEMFLDFRVSTAQIRQIVNYIVKTYNLDAVFFTKSHSIKVWHRNAR